MELEERKQIFANLLAEMLDREGGIKNKLAQRLGIKASRLTAWCQGKVDPAGLEILIFDRIAKEKGCSVDELATLFELKKDLAEQPLDKLRNLVTEMLVGQSQEQLSKKLGISKNTIRAWFNTTKNIDPSFIPAGTLASLAQERKWSIERLLAYLGLKKFEETEEDLLGKIQSLAIQLSLANQVKMQTWFSKEIEAQLGSLKLPIQSSSKKEPLKNQPKIFLVLEEEDLTIASNYFSNLAEYLQFQPKNIKIATIPKLPQSLADIDILIFDINTTDSPSIQLIEDLTFNGDIIIFADAIALPLIRDKISSAVSEIFVKPVDWSALQSFPYFQSK